MPALFRKCLLLLALSCAPLVAHAKPWESLNPQQKDALSPLSKTWDSLPEKQQTNFLAIAKRYPKLNGQQKQKPDPSR